MKLQHDFNPLMSHPVFSTADTNSILCPNPASEHEQVISGSDKPFVLLAVTLLGSSVAYSVL